jgi:hypothetical protein
MRGQEERAAVARGADPAAGVKERKEAPTFLTAKSAKL